MPWVHSTTTPTTTRSTTQTTTATTTASAATRSSDVFAACVCLTHAYRAGWFHRYVQSCSSFVPSALHDRICVLHLRMVYTHLPNVIPVVLLIIRLHLGTFVSSLASVVADVRCNGPEATNTISNCVDDVKPCNNPPTRDAS